jgi:ABC-type cobalamin/Fe3+-siderophores transport system ATPase subunit
VKLVPAIQIAHGRRHRRRRRRRHRHRRHCRTVHAGLTVLVGAVGSGKSTLLAGLMEHIGTGTVTLQSQT